jgi:hypothetical protein
LGEEPLPEEPAQLVSRRGHPERLPSRRPSASSGSGISFTVDECWSDGWLGRTTIVADESGFRRATDADPAPEGHLTGTVLPGFRDAHVHLGLVDGTALLAGGIAAVDDFGWDLDLARTWPGSDDLPEVTIAGQLMTAPGGYPVESGWAPRAACCELATASEAAAAVDRQLAAGAGFVKVALNSDAGPVLDDETLRAVVGRAHALRIPVATHAQGAGQAARAFEAGVDVLAHTPWTERLDDDLIRAMATAASGALTGAMTWVSTLDIHGWGSFDGDFVVASDNLRRFHGAGGRIRYGTDLGNGPLPLGINPRELVALEHAGLGLDALVAAIASAPERGGLGRRLSVVADDPGDAPAAWLATAELIDHDRLKEHLA